MSPKRECSVCGRALVLSPKLDVWRCAFCQRHGKRKRDQAPTESAHVTRFEGVEVDST